ncbi:hypothetical protein BRAS3843_1080041 [Bradyrhizobium sp. STM 3843]|nr:hypothetical protein BRAS3843_1080041 [Bradyrhizobium sp. STM 3843]
MALPLFVLTCRARACGSRPATICFHPSPLPRSDLAAFRFLHLQPIGEICSFSPLKEASTKHLQLARTKWAAREMGSPDCFGRMDAPDERRNDSPIPT